MNEGANHVDTRPEEYTSISLCSGYGGIEIALREAVRTRTLCYVEIGAEVCEILVNLMGQELIEDAPIWSDLANFPVDIFRDRCDVLQGGFPCQPFSHAGLRKGVSDERNLWPSVSRVIRGVRPSVIFLENVPGILPYYFDTIRPELSEMGYVVAEGLFSAGVDGGAPQKRQRLFILAYSPGTRMQRRGIPQHLRDYLDGLAHATGTRLQGQEHWLSGDASKPGSELAHAQRYGDICGEDEKGHELQSRDRGGSPQHLSGTVISEVADTGQQHQQLQRRGIRPESQGEGNELADAEGSDVRSAHQEGVRGREPEDEIGSRSSTIRRPEGAARELADAECLGTQGEAAGQQPTEQWINHHREEAFPLFPPGPNDARGWEWVLSRWPRLSPTYCKEGHDVQPEVPTSPSRVRGVVDGPMSGVDKRLRAVGNGVVPITCAIAFHTLGRGRIF